MTEDPNSQVYPSNDKMEMLPQFSEVKELVHDDQSQKVPTKVMNGTGSFIRSRAISAMVMKNDDYT